MSQTYLENNPNYPPLLWWPPARKSLWFGEERAGVRVSMLCPPPPQSSPIKGEDKTWLFSWFAGDALVMGNYLENNRESLLV
jgi:hypothetical protein